LLSQTINHLQARAEAMVRRAELPKEVLRIEETEAEVGGGTMPKTRLPSVALTFCPSGIKPERIAQYFRENNPPIVGYLRNNALQINLRTILSNQESIVIDCLKKAWEHFEGFKQSKS
jgi:L-seryl-tRNA(Ser) seleniumtransferase